MPTFKHRLPSAVRAGALPVLCAMALATSAGYAAQPQRTVTAGLIHDGIPPAAGAGAADLERYLQARPVQFLDWLADGSLLLAMPGGDTNQLYRVAGPLRAPEQLSHFDGPVLGAVAKAYEANGVAALRSDQAGGVALYALDTVSRQQQQLVAAELAPTRPLWAHDGRRLLYTSRQSGDGQLQLLDTASASSRLVTNGGNWEGLDWTLDDRELLALLRRPELPPQLVRIDAATLAPQYLALVPQETADRRRAAAGAPKRITRARYASDGRAVLLLAAWEGDNLRLWRQPLDGSPAIALSPARPHDLDDFAQSPDGRYLAYSYEDGGYSRVVLVDHRAGSERIIAALPTGVVGALKFDRRGAQLAIHVDSPSLPGEVHVLDLASFALVRWTQTELGPLAPGELAIPSAVRVPAWDQNSDRSRSLPALIYRPRGGTSRDAKLPVLVALPENSDAPHPRYDAVAQALVNALRCAVIVPTIRGDLDTPAGRELAARDTGALLVWIGMQPDLDRARIVVRGTAATSAVALTVLAKFGDRLRGAIVQDSANAGSPAEMVERPVLLMRGLVEAPASLAITEQLMWRLRAARIDTWVLATPLEQLGTMSNAQRLEALRVQAQFLGSVFSAPAPGR